MFVFTRRFFNSWSFARVFWTSSWAECCCCCFICACSSITYTFSICCITSACIKSTILLQGETKATCHRCWVFVEACCSITRVFWTRCSGWRRGCWLFGTGFNITCCASWCRCDWLWSCWVCDCSIWRGWFCRPISCGLSGMTTNLISSRK